MPKDISLEGYTELQKKFHNMIDIIDEREMNKALMRPVRKLRTAIRRAAPEGPTGNLRRGIVAGKFKPAIKGAPGFFVRVSGRIAPHAWLVEHGTGGLRYPTHKASKVKAGKWLAAFNGIVRWIEHTGRMPANPFFRRTVDARRNETEAGLVKETWNVVSMAWKKK